MPSLEAALLDALEATLDTEVPPAVPSISQLVGVLGGPGRGGGTTRLAGLLGVTPRTVQRWRKAERGEVGETRAAVTARVRGLTAAQQATAGRIRGLWTDRGRRLDVLERRLHGRKLVVAFNLTWAPYPEGQRPAWRDLGRWSPVVLPAHRAAPIFREGLQALRTGDEVALARAAGLLAGELAATVGLPEAAEADEAHVLTVSFE